jgi:hypothetical protein
MSKLLESFVSDAMARIKSPEVQEAVHENLLAPLLAYLLPYLLAIVGLWFAILIGIILILAILLRGRPGIQ